MPSAERAELDSYRSKISYQFLHTFVYCLRATVHFVNADQNVETVFAGTFSCDLSGAVKHSRSRACVDIVVCNLTLSNTLKFWTGTGPEKARR